MARHHNYWLTLLHVFLFPQRDAGENRETMWVSINEFRFSFVYVLYYCSCRRIGSSCLFSVIVYVLQWVEIFNGSHFNFYLAGMQWTLSWTPAVPLCHKDYLFSLWCVPPTGTLWGSPGAESLNHPVEPPLHWIDSVSRVKYWLTCMCKKGWNNSWCHVWMLSIHSHAGRFPSFTFPVLETGIRPGEQELTLDLVDSTGLSTTVSVQQCVTAWL